MDLPVVLVRSKVLHLMEGNFNEMLLALFVVLDCLIIVLIDSLDQVWIDQVSVRNLIQECDEGGFYVSIVSSCETLLLVGRLGAHEHFGVLSSRDLDRSLRHTALRRVHGHVGAGSILPHRAVVL